MNKYTIVLTREEDARYSVSVRALPCCYTGGDTTDGPRSMAREAIEMYLEELRSRKLAAPADTVIVSSVEVA